MEPQVLIPVPETPPRLAGLPAFLRSAHGLATDLPGLRVILRLSARFETDWSRALAQVPGLGEPIDEEKPLLVLSPHGLLDPRALKDFIGRVDGLPISWVWRGEVVAAYYPRAADLPPDPFARPPRESMPLPEGGWTPLGTARERLAAEETLFKSMGSVSDGYIARHDRRLSLALSRLLIRTPVTPNQITTASLLLGILGAWALTTTSYPWQAAGALALWFCCLLDGCDGEVARLKLQCSESGALYDTVADHLAHLITFAGIALHIRNNHPGLSWAPPAGLMLAGVALSMHAVWRLILSRPAGAASRLQRVFERIASRDYVYLVLILVLVGRLEWFLWGAAVGSHVFWVSLWWISRAVSRP